MNTTELPVSMLVVGIILVFAALVLLFTVVFQPTRVIPLTRRRPDQVNTVSGLTRLTDSAVGLINRRLKTGTSAPVDREKMERAGLKMQPADFLLMMAAGAVLGGLIGYILSGLALAIVLLVAFPGGMLLWLAITTAKRQKAFADQLPDTLQMFTGSMRAGHSLLRAIDAAAAEGEAPMSQELSRIVNEVRIGRALNESMQDVAKRTGSEDFDWVAQAIEIHREVGGELAEVLDHLAETIRDRNQIQRQVQALSAEGRMSAIVLMALPIVLFVALLFINPSYAVTFTTTLPGLLMLIVAAIMLAIGGFWLSRLIKPKY
ncbi:type II secretion system F family protein [Pseudarthrobacter sp. J1738]|uniref:type II secretion system F family protein n=1 Tax=unclassified Pseudarthrobacter TaxID=2647000 RepID=UPI003D2C44E1